MSVIKNEIIRTKYLQEVIDTIGLHFIKVITGVRRSGKSWLLKQFKRYLLKTGVQEEQIIEYDFNKLELQDLTYKELHDQIIAKSSKDKVNFLLLDEIQDIDDFEKAIISLFENETIDYDIYLTGSNSKMFSSKLATLFTGRNLQIKVLPFSFKEFYDFNIKYNFKRKDQLGVNKKPLFDLYMKYGGLPILLKNVNNNKVKENELSQVLYDTVQKDIKTRHSIKNITEFNRVAKFVLLESGKEISVMNTANYLKSNEKSKIAHTTIERYLNWMREALLIYKAELYDIKGKNCLKTTAKYFAVDSGIKNIQDNFNSWNSGYTIESIVYIELLRRDYEVYVGKLKYSEIDFVCKNSKGDITYIQVTKTLKDGEDKALWDREVGNLLSIKDNFEKIVISYEDQDRILPNGIKIYNLIDWLLDEK
ncbi:MAG: ATP-binding protein [Mycoplasmoidaceae bacterium]|nr:MAG: ATP-binding protein [Mycoplasmoidaceae bacterium]